MKNPIFVALDIDDAHQAIALSQKLKGKVGGFKLGPRLLMKQGRAIVEAVAENGMVFVDNKYFDIPNTMESAVTATFESGASFCTVHAQSGVEALQRMARLEQKLNEKRPFKILSVTVLTSFDQQTLPPNQLQYPLDEQVTLLAKLSMQSGITGVVCSPNEVQALRSQFSDGFFVTPGVRLQAVANDDQKRVMTPQAALQQGASALVIGRPIVAAADPLAAVEDILATLRPL